MHRTTPNKSLRYSKYSDNVLAPPLLLVDFETQGYTVSESIEAAPGNVVSETEHATTYQGATAATFEGEIATKHRP